jgi:hypothetical protein
MQPNKKKIALVLGALLLGATSASNADPFIATITTLDDVALGPVASYDLTYGTNILVAANQECAMDASTPGNTLMQYAASALVPQATWGDLTGAACVTGTSGTPGVYEVSGISGGTVKLLLTTITQTGGDYTFIPDGGCFLTFSAGTVSNADVCTTIVPGTVHTVVLPLGTGAEDEVGNGASVEGVTRFTVGGTLNTGPTGLTAESNYELSFQVDVTY